MELSPDILDAQNERHMQALDAGVSDGESGKPYVNKYWGSLARSYKWGYETGARSRPKQNSPSGIEKTVN